MNAPLGEFINLSPDATSIQPYFGGLFKDEPLPKDGKITLEQALNVHGDVNNII